MGHVQLSRDSQHLLARFAGRFPQDQLEVCRSHGKGGEWGELVDVMCAVLVRRNIPVTQDEKDALAELLAMFPASVEDHEYIDHREETLAALHVTGGTQV